VSRLSGPVTIGRACTPTPASPIPPSFKYAQFPRSLSPLRLAVLSIPHRWFGVVEGVLPGGPVHSVPPISLRDGVEITGSIRYTPLFGHGLINNNYVGK
jgi:hypothetical protein